MRALLGSFRSWWATPIAGICGALIAEYAHWPLPWIIGSMLAIIIVRCSGLLVGEIPNGRITGQLVIATSIGLHFTQAVVTEIGGNFALMMAASCFTLIIALLGIAVMKRQGMDLTTAYFAFMPANFTEMIQLGIQHKANVSRVAAAHSVRLVLIVLCVPPALFFTSHISPEAIHIRPPADWYWLTPLLAGGAIVALIWKRLRWPNPWMFGPMSLCAVFTATYDLHIALPAELNHYGQLMIGCALGGFFNRDFFRKAPAYLVKVAIFTIVMATLTFLAAILISHLFNFPTLTMTLGMMPGSSTEMYLTAEALNLGVGFVTAMQIMRLVIVMSCAEPIYKVWYKRTQINSTDD